MDDDDGLEEVVINNIIVQNFDDVFCITGEAIIAALHRCYGIADTLSFAHVSIEWLRISMF